MSTRKDKIIRMVRKDTEDASLEDQSILSTPSQTNFVLVTQHNEENSLEFLQDCNNFGCQDLLKIYVGCEPHEIELNNESIVLQKTDPRLIPDAQKADANNKDSVV